MELTRAQALFCSLFMAANLNHAVFCTRLIGPFSYPNHTTIRGPELYIMYAKQYIVSIIFYLIMDFFIGR